MQQVAPGRSTTHDITARAHTAGRTRCRRLVQYFCPVWFDRETNAYRSRPLRILLQVYDMPGFSVASNTKQSGWYFTLRTRAHRDSGFCKSRQLWRASMAMLKMCRSLNPRPPFFFVFINLSHAIQWHLSFPPCWLHQYRPIIVLISSHKLLVRSKHDIAYVGMACATA